MCEDSELNTEKSATTNMKSIYRSENYQNMTEQEILERISSIGKSIKLTPEVDHSSDDLLVISVLQEWDTGKGIVMWFVKFSDGKAIQQITAKGDPA